MNSYNDAALTAAGTVGIIIFTLIVSLFSLVLSVLLIIAMWKLFTKAGVEGWKSIIPFYNTYVMCELSIANNAILWFILLFIPFANYVAMFYLYYKFALAYGKDTLGGILNALFAIIYTPIMAFSKSTTYIGPQ